MNGDMCDYEGRAGACSRGLHLRVDPCLETRPMSSRICRARRSGFTLTEMLMVIVVISLLAALLLPAIGGAVRRAREAAVNAEINQLAQALTDFKSKYGD